MTSEIGAVYDALLIKRAVESGVVDGVNAWNDADGTYGKLFSEYDDYKGLHQGGYLLKYFNQYGLGEVKSTASSNEDKAEGYTVQNSNGDAMFVLINKDASGTVALNTNGWTPPSSTVLKKIISSAGISESTVSWTDALTNQTMSANSIIIFIAGSSVLTPTENELEQNIIIYPNPTNGKFQIDIGDSNKATIVVYDVYGKIIYNREILDKSSYVDLAGRTGIFIVIVNTNKGSVSKKVLVR